MLIKIMSLIIALIVSNLEVFSLEILILFDQKTLQADPDFCFHTDNGLLHFIAEQVNTSVGPENTEHNLSTVTENGTLELLERSPPN